jgi:hypothetical protein
LCQHGLINLCPVEEPQDSVHVTLSHSHGHFLLDELRHSAPSVWSLIISNRLMGVKLILWPVPCVPISQVGGSQVFFPSSS